MIIRKSTKSKIKSVNMLPTPTKKTNKEHLIKAKQLYSLFNPKRPSINEESDNRSQGDYGGQMKSRLKMEAPTRKSSKLIKILCNHDESDCDAGPFPPPDTKNLSDMCVKDLNPSLQQKCNEAGKRENNSEYEEEELKDGMNGPLTESEKYSKVAKSEHKKTPKMQESEICPICSCYVDKRLIESHANFCLTKLEKGINLYTNEPMRRSSPQPTKSRRRRKLPRKRENTNLKDDILKDDPLLLERIESVPNPTTKRVIADCQKTKKRDAKAGFKSALSSDKHDSDAEGSSQTNANSTKNAFSN